MRYLHILTHLGPGLIAALLVTIFFLAACAVVQAPPEESDGAGVASRAAPSNENDFFERLAARQTAQPVDAGWAPEKERAIRMSYADQPPLLEARMEKVACATSLCRIELSFLSEQTRLQSQPALFRWLTESQACSFYIPAPGLGVGDREVAGTVPEGVVTQPLFLECRR